MKTGLHWAARVSAVAAFTFALPAVPAAAQSTEDCRCVDRDGNEIERCSCFRAPRFEALLGPWAQSDARPRLGISVDVRQSARRDAEGALVTDVLEDGPADAAGIRRGDIITRIDGQSLFEPLEGEADRSFDLDQSVPVQRLLAIARELEPAEQVEVEYLRDGERQTVTVEAEELSDTWGQGRSSLMMPRFDRRGTPRAFEFEPGAGGELRVFGGPGAAGLVVGRLGGARYGVELVELNPSLGSYFGVESGVLVADVEEDSALGLQPGDVVLRIGDREVTTPERMLRILGSYGEDEAVTLRVRREGRELDVQGRVGG